ncbi:MAG: PQQ-binding-like beta-propeller repeat protein [Thermoguttaceae bacterium]
MLSLFLLCILAVTTRNNVANDATDLPVQIVAGKFERRAGKWLGGDTVRGVAWVAPLGDTTYGTPVVAGDRVFVATNNKGGYDPQFPKSVDLGVLLAFDRESGKMLWQYSSPKLEDTAIDWPEQGICSNACVEGERLWIATNRGEVAALSVVDGSKLWSFDMIEKLGVVPHCMTSSSPLVVGDLVVSGTSNGVGADDKTVVNPSAPSLVAFNKNSGELVWSNASPGDKILDGQWSSPAWDAASETLLFGAGDGFLYGFTQAGKQLFRIDGNLPNTVWKGHGAGDRNTIVATPVVAEGSVFLPMGQDPESGEGPSVLWCYDIADIDNVQPRVRWKYEGRDPLSKDFEDKFHRTIASVVVADGIVWACDFSGVVHCLDAKTGELFWTHDAMGAIWGGGLVADGKLYVGTASGDLLIFAASREKKLLHEVALGAPITTSPVAVGKMLFVATAKNLFAFREE